MFQTQSKLATDNAQKYVQMLGHHFARKVTVSEQEKYSVVQFPMGVCTMHHNSDHLLFECQAESQEGLLVIQSIIDNHMHLLKKVKNKQLSWIDIAA